MTRPRASRAHGGHRADLGLYFRSRWEANYARYLKWLEGRGDIRGWGYETAEWQFPVKRGVRFYKSDFEVIENDGRVAYYEVKGWMDQRSRTALDRMARYYPEVRIIVIDRAAYREIESKVAGLIEGWEDGNR